VGGSESRDGQSTPPPRPADPLRLRWRHAALVVALAVVVHLNALPNDFAYDDLFAITRNGDVTTSPLSDIFVHDFWGQDITRNDSHKSYRPVTTLSFRLSNALWGLHPLPFRAENLLLHAAVSLLVYLLAAHFTPPTPSLLAASLFATHPSHVEAVVGLVGRAELLAAIPPLVALLAILRSEAKGGDGASFRCAAGAAVLILAATFAKESALAWLAVVAAADALTKAPLFVSAQHWNSPAMRRFSLRFAAKCAMYAAIGGGYVYFRARLTVDPLVRNYRRLENPFAFTHGAARVLTLMNVHLKYAQLAVMPLSLSADYSFNCIPPVDSLTDPRNVLSAGFYATVIALTLASLRNLHKPAARTCLLALVLYASTFLPASNLLFNVGTAVAERLLYAPTVAVALGLAAALHHAGGGRTGRVLLLVGVGVGVYFFARTVIRNRDWRDEESLFLAAEGVCPNSAKVQQSVGVILRR
jgi:protein O-mannosyl-transferase